MIQIRMVRLLGGAAPALALAVAFAAVRPCVSEASGWERGEELLAATPPAVSPSPLGLDVARRPRTTRREVDPSSGPPRVFESSSGRPDASGVLVAGVHAAQMSFLASRPELLAARAGMRSYWSTTTPPPLLG